MKKIRKILIKVLICLLFGCCMYTHRRVIHAWLNGEKKLKKLTSGEAMRPPLMF